MKKKRRIENSQLSYLIQKYSPVQYIRKHRRNRKLKKTSVGKKKGNKAKSTSLRLPHVKIQFVIGFIVFLIVFLAGIHINHFLKISPEPLSEQRIENFYSSPNYNSVFIIGDDQENNVFIEGVVIVSINTSDNQSKFLGVDTSLITEYPITRQTYTLKSLYNQIESEQSLLEYIDILEAVTGIRIDRYFYTTKTDIDTILTKSSISTRAVENVDGSQNVYSEGQRVRSEDLTDYLFSSSSSSNKNNIMTSFVYDYLQNKNSILSRYSLFWDARVLLDNINTDMTKNEVFTFFDLLQTNDFREPLLIGDDIGFPATTGIEDGIGINQLALQETIEEYMRSLSVLTEQVQVEVYNATDTGGLAGSVRNQLSPYGINVVKVSNFSEKRVFSQIIVFSDIDNAFPNTTAIIQKTLGSNQDVEITNRDALESGNYAGDIVVILGSDYLSD